MTTDTRFAPIRVAYLGHSAALSGAEIALLRLLPALDDVLPFVVLAEDGPLVARLRAAGIAVEVVALPARTAALRRTALASLPTTAALGDVTRYATTIARRLRDLDVDLVHTNSMKAHLYGGAAARMAGIPQIWHARDRATPDYLPRPAVRLVRAAARLLPHALVANSHATLETYGSIPAGFVVHDAADGAQVVARRPHDGELRVGVVGRLTPWKGQHVFLRAFARALGAGAARAVVIGAPMFGEDEYAAQLATLARTLGVADRVEFTGFRDDVAGELARLDVLVHCSTIPEPFGQVVVEGMAAGVPVIAADAGGPAEIVTHGVSGLLTPPADVDALASALRRLAGDPVLRRVLAGGGLAASRRYRPERVAEEVQAIYGQVLGPRRALRRRDQAAIVAARRQAA